MFAFICVYILKQLTDIRREDSINQLKIHTGNERGLIMTARNLHGQFLGKTKKKIIDQWNCFFVVSLHDFFWLSEYCRLSKNHHYRRTKKLFYNNEIIWYKNDVLLCDHSTLACSHFFCEHFFVHKNQFAPWFCNIYHRKQICLVIIFSWPLLANG